MDTIQARRRARSRLLRSLDELDGHATPTSDGSRCLSLDVFDTVVTRSCGRPADLFVWLGRRLLRRGVTDCSPEVFASVRANAEQAVWRREGYLDSNAGLPEFYEEVVRRLYLDPALIPDLVEAELALETECLKPIPAAERLIGRRREAASPTIFVTDTYFPAEFIKTTLRDLGLAPDGTEYVVSSEHARSKASGRLFENLFTDGRSPGDVLHVGDHPHSDVAVPLRMGLEARWCVDARLNRYEKQLAEAASDTAGFAASLAGASRLARLATMAQTPEEAAIRDVAAGVAAPMLVGYVLWILKRAQDLSLKRLAFLARDGQVLADIARKLADALGLSIDIRYVFVSRRSTNLAATFEANEEETGWVFRDVPLLSASEFLDRFDLEWDDVSVLLGRSSDQPPPSAASEISEAFREGLSDGPLRDLILEKAAARREVVLDYLRQENLLDDEAQGIVDFGGVGSQVRALHIMVRNAGARPPRIFMIGLDARRDAVDNPDAPEPEWADDTECYLYDHRRGRGIKRARGFGTCVQMFCAADHGTVTGYSRADGVVRPDLEMEIDDRVVDWGLPLFRATVGNFVDSLTLDEDLLDPYADIRDLTCDVIATFWSKPERAEAAAWGSFPFEGAQASGGEPKPLANRYTVGSIRRDLAAGKFPNLGWQHWYEGSLALSDPAIRTVLKQVETAYRKSERKKGGIHGGLVAAVRKLAGR